MAQLEGTSLLTQITAWSGDMCVSESPKICKKRKRTEAFTPDEQSEQNSSITQRQFKKLKLNVTHIPSSLIEYQDATDSASEATYDTTYSHI